MAAWKLRRIGADAMRVKNGKIAEHSSVANIYSLMQQIGAASPSS
jgi:hypothetical protein